MTRSLNMFGLIALAVILIAAGLMYFLKEDLPKIYINEIMANNTACCPDKESGKDEFDDWIELYNAGTVPVDIGGMYFSQEKDNHLGYHVPKTNSALTTIPPGGFLLLWADGDHNQGPLHLKFKLAFGGEYIGIYQNDGRKIDGLKFQNQSENVSYGRATDGSETWKEFASPTPGKSNQ